MNAPDWTAIARECATLPVLPLLGALPAIDARFDGLDLWLWDHQRRTLGSMRTGARVNADADVASIVAAGHALSHQGDELGFATVNGDNADADVMSGLAALLAVAVRAGAPTTDAIDIRRRHDRMSLPAEMQWALLPPTRFDALGASVSAAVEPAYDTGGDIFEYALLDDRLFLAVLDARGHGLRAATTAAVATSALRRARREGADLLDIAGEVGASIGALGDEDEFVSAVMVELDTTTWQARWLSAGHHAPLMVSSGGVEALPLRPTLPLGMIVNGQSSEPVVQQLELTSDQSLVLFSDGVIENAALDDGHALGDARFHRALIDNVSPAERPPHVARSVVEDLLAITGAVLRDDATLMIVDRAV